jgi:phosphomannomutase
MKKLPSRTKDLASPVGIALRPSIKKKAMIVARRDGRTLSGLVAHLLTQHLKKNGITLEESPEP